MKKVTYAQSTTKGYTLSEIRNDFLDMALDNSPIELGPDAYRFICCGFM